MNTKHDYQSVINGLTVAIEKTTWSKRSIELLTKRFWPQFKIYLDQHNISEITTDVCDSYLLSKFGDVDVSRLNSYNRHILRSITFIKDYIKSGVIKPRKVAINFKGDIGLNMLKYIALKKDERISLATIHNIESSLFQFQEFLHKKGINAIMEIEITHIVEHLNTIGLIYKTSAARFCYTSRNFFKFLYDNGLKKTDLSIFIPTYHYDSHSKLPSTYNDNEVTKVIESVDRSTKTGKRDYAVMLLLSALGLRASDVANIKFEDINWAQNRINLIQFKTGKEVELPLLSEIGNAIIDYLKYARPISSEPFVFLKASKPFNKVAPSVITQIARKYFLVSGVNVRNKHHGAHALRHSLATRLLNQNTKLSVISEVLGHRTIQSTMFYLNIDIESLRKCSLDVSDISESFYQQKGGYFYGI